jgi:parallel beta-helix repeat protein
MRSGALILVVLLLAVMPACAESQGAAAEVRLAALPKAAGVPTDHKLPDWGPEEKIPSLRVSVKEAGARGDGKADDTAAIQAAVGRVGKDGGGVVYFPDGVYKVSGSIVVKHDRVALEGAGWGAEIQMVKHPKRVIVIQGSRNNIVRNLKISLGVANVQRHDEDVGIYVTSKARNFLIEGVYGNKKAIMVRGGVSHGTIRNNTIRDTLADGIHLTGGSRYILVTGNELTHTGDDSIAVVSYESQKALTQHVVIAGNRIRNSLARGIAHAGGYQVDIWDNSIEGTSSSGILADRDLNFGTFAAVNTTIEGNTITGAGTFGKKRGNQFGIELSEGAANVTVFGNQVTGGKSRGISVSADNTVIRGNTSLNNGDSGLEISADGCTVAGNRFENNGTYGFYAENSHQLIFSGNRLADNNTRKAKNIDNFVLKDSRNSVVKGNISVETRDEMLIERAFELTGSCPDTVFESNQIEGTRLGTVIECTP